MRNIALLTHKFVEFIPRELEADTIYVSIPYATAIHNCCCGCGNRVVTPISPTDWILFFDGRSISLEPSIGNWSFPCRSHYYIRNNRVVWSDKWSNAEIKVARKKDVRATAAYFKTKTEGSLSSTAKAAKPKQRSGFKAKIKNWLKVTR
jgi:hypothetical protein